MMRLLVVTQYFWPESFLINDFALDMQSRGHKVIVLTGLPNYPKGQFHSGYSFFKGPWYEEKEGLKIYRVPLIPRFNNKCMLAINYCSFVFFGCLYAIFFGFFKEIKKVDLLFCFGLSPITSCFPAIILKKILNCPLFVWVQDLWPESIEAVGVTKNKFLLGQVKKMVTWIYKKTDCIFVPSESFKKNIEAYQIQKNKIFFVPNWGISQARLKKKPDWLNSLPEGFRITFAGNLGSAQSLTTLIQAACLLKDDAAIKWIIVGDGSEKKMLLEKIKEHQLEKNIYCYDRRPVDEMPDLFAESDALYFSLRNDKVMNLTIPSKVQSYMAAGKPILGSVSGEAFNLIQLSQSGLVSEAENPEDLAKNILQLKAMAKDQRLQLGENGLSYFQNHFTKEKVISKIEKLFKQEISE